MQNYRARIRPLSAFGTPLLGDTLFGQLCWAIRNRQGEASLEKLLQGYVGGQPFLVVSDAFPAGFVPKPDLPSSRFEPVPDTLRKQIKKRTWLPLDKLAEPLPTWQQHCCNDQQAGFKVKAHPQPHNSIDRRSGTTNDSGFAPYSMNQFWYGANSLLECYFLIDDARFSPVELEAVLRDIGQFGYGRDASIGLGKFCLVRFEPFDLPAQQQANACLTLAPCAPQRLGFDARNSFYQPFTRFGRHGDIAVHRSAQPFKNPVLLVRAGAVFATSAHAGGWIGQGLGGDGRLSKSVPGTVQQGYAPVIPIHRPVTREQAA